MKIIIIALAAVLLSVFPATAMVAAPSCPTDITVGSGQYVKLSTTPVDQASTITTGIQQG